MLTDRDFGIEKMILDRIYEVVMAAVSEVWKLNILIFQTSNFPLQTSYSLDAFAGELIKVSIVSKNIEVVFCPKSIIKQSKDKRNKILLIQGKMLHKCFTGY